MHEKDSQHIRERLRGIFVGFRTMHKFMVEKNIYSRFRGVFVAYIFNVVFNSGFARLVKARSDHIASIVMFLGNDLTLRFIFRLLLVLPTRLSSPIARLCAGVIRFRYSRRRVLS